ncbi:MAG: DMT family transporter [Planctomycetota bacterium]|jgi:drug/metabolite transporter (DMT)-like permease
MGKQKRAYLYASVAVLFWSTIASAFKISFRYIDILPLLFYASIVASVFLFLYLLSLNKLNFLKALSTKDYLHSALLGLLNPFLYYVILINAYSILKAQEAVTLNFIWPIMLVLLSIPLLHQRIKPKSILAIIISFIGVFIIATGGDILGFRFTSTAGVLLAVSSAVIWALFWIYNVKDKRDEAVRLFLNFAFGSVYIFLSMLFLAKVEIPNLNGFLGAAYIGLFEMGITFLIWLKALNLSKTTSHVASLVYLAPFLSLVVISFAVGEEILFSTIIGLIFIIGGIILQKF